MWHEARFTEWHTHSVHLDLAREGQGARSTLPAHMNAIGVGLIPHEEIGLGSAIRAPALTIVIHHDHDEGLGRLWLDGLSHQGLGALGLGLALLVDGVTLALGEEL